MRLDLLYFAWVRESVGKAEETLEIPLNVTTVSELLSWLSRRGPGYDIFEEVGRLRCAVDQVFCTTTTPLSGVREVAIFPPVTGG